MHTVLAIVSEPLAHGTPREGREVLKRRSLVLAVVPSLLVEDVRVFVHCRATRPCRRAATVSAEVGRGGAGKFLHGRLVAQVDLSA